MEPKYRGGGYGSEAKHLLLEYAFERLGLHMVRSFVTFRNTRSAAALRKQGYKEAGRLHWTFNLHGTYGNAVVFDLLAEEWRAMPRASS
jgi:RimJ/RimL family protein N-acetyltransferase